MTTQNTGQRSQTFDLKAIDTVNALSLLSGASMPDGELGSNEASSAHSGGTHTGRSEPTFTDEEQQHVRFDQARAVAHPNEILVVHHEVAEDDPFYTLTQRILGMHAASLKANGDPGTPILLEGKEKDDVARALPPIFDGAKEDHPELVGLETGKVLVGREAKGGGLRIGAPKISLPKFSKFKFPGLGWIGKMRSFPHGTIFLAAFASVIVVSFGVTVAIIYIKVVVEPKEDSRKKQDVEAAENAEGGGMNIELQELDHSSAGGAINAD
ncbi:hypothetical protein QFC24_000048 [Naganishia onofrii]|uniref:Uncharacterized protein n=1 Tax=Naganishia onofrii TaxID=1851511 RepID=A0ACC2XUP9_9TREE|nr:hypothetical protein QFC24_000048 [Naganishia onofrii]